MSENPILAAMCGVVAMTVINLSVVNVALPSIQSDLHADPADLQWVVVVYGVFVAGFLLLGGRAGDLLGHRKVLVSGIALLAAGSLLGGVSTSLTTLLAGRALQGVGSALAAPNALAILSRTFAEGAERNRALGIFGAAGGTAAIGGSVLGGLLVQGPGWHWAFWINVPVGAALAALVLARVPADAARPRVEHADTVGALALTAGLMAVAFGVHESVGEGWLARATLGPVLGGLALLAGFVVHEGRTPQPLVALATLRRRSLLAANLSGALMWASFLGLIYATTLFLQEVHNYEPLAAGASTIPIAVVSLVVSAKLAPPAIDRFGAATTLAAGLLSLGAGVALLTRAPHDAGYASDLLGPFCVVGVGIGLAQVAVQIAAFAGVAEHEAGLAGGAVETSTEMGGAIGVALLVSVALSGTHDATAVFHRTLAGAAVVAVLAAVVAFALLRPTERTDGTWVGERA